MTTYRVYKNNDFYTFEKKSRDEVFTIDMLTLDDLYSAFLDYYPYRKPRKIDIGRYTNDRWKTLATIKIRRGGR